MNLCSLDLPTPPAAASPRQLVADCKAEIA